MKTWATLIAIALGSISSLAQANVTSSLSGPGSIFVGDTATFSANITDIGQSGYNWEEITAVSYSFYSGDGQTHSGSLSGLWTSSLDLTTTFDYGTTGSYTPSFDATVQTTDQYTQWYSGAYWVNSGYESCWFSCWWVDTSHYQYYSYYENYQTNLQFDTSSSTSLNVMATPVPEPETYAMLLAGLGLLGFMGRRRRQKPLNPTEYQPMTKEGV